MRVFPSSDLRGNIILAQLLRIIKGGRDPGGRAGS